VVSYDDFKAVTTRKGMAECKVRVGCLRVLPCSSRLRLHALLVLGLGYCARALTGVCLLDVEGWVLRAGCGWTGATAQEAGKYRQEGKGYIVNDGDIIHFLFNPAGNKSGGSKK
jgi:hypothetical protein